MNNNASKPLTARVIEAVLTVLTVIMILITVFLVFDFADSYRFYTVSSYNESSYRYALEEGEYARLTYFVKETEPYEHPSADIRRYFGIGQYFYASTMRDIADIMGDEEFKSYWQAQKESAAQNCGALSEYTVLIDEQLNR